LTGPRRQPSPQRDWVRFSVFPTGGGPREQATGQASIRCQQGARQGRRPGQARCQSGSQGACQGASQDRPQESHCGPRQTRDQDRRENSRPQGTRRQARAQATGQAGCQSGNDTGSQAGALPKAAAKPAAAPASLAPVPAPAPAANRFTDRFAPAVRPVARQMTETAELPKPAQKIDPKLANAWKNKPGRELTIDELLAMPDSEYMNDKQIEFFRANLQKQKDDLLSNAGETTEHLREDTSIVPDPADRATIEEEHALELRTRDRERKLLKKIAQSLARLDSGEYGFCDETGEPIGLARLLARPTATLSLEAQQRRELKQKMFGD
jgi:DnaK suppressor protein